MKKIFLGLASFAFVLILLGRIFLPTFLDKQMNPVSDHLPFVVSDRAKELHQTLIIGDWHSDSALWNRDLSKTYDYGHEDIPRMQTGNIALQMFTTVTKSPSGQNYDSNETAARDNITSLAIVQGWPIKTWTSLTERAIFQAENFEILKI